MRIFVTFGDENYAKSRSFAAKMARLIGGFDKVIEYKPEDIDESFKERHKDIFKIKRGFGLWLWKPYFIYKTLVDVISDGDSLFYADAGSFFIRNVKHIEKSMKDDMWISSIPFNEWQFTKKDTIYTLGCNEDRILKTPQRQACFLYMRKTEASVSFVKEWLDWCSDINILHPENILTGQPNSEDFFAHREDQSILSLLSKKYGIKAHQDPSQFGRCPSLCYKRLDPKYTNTSELSDKREYPVCIVLHRTGDMNVMIIMKQLLMVILPKSILSVLNFIKFKILKDTSM